MELCFGTMFFTLFLIINAFGNTSGLHEVMKGVAPKRYWRVMVRELLIALGVMLLFDFIGDALLDKLEVSEITVRLTAGLILLLVAFGVLFSSPSSLKLRLKADEEPFVVPLALPMVASPALLATIMLYAHIQEDGDCRLMAILLAWGLSSLIFLTNRFWVRLFGQNGLIAFERLLAMILVMLAIQRVMEGLQLFQITYIMKG